MQSIFVGKNFSFFKRTRESFLWCVLSDMHTWTVYRWHSNELCCVCGCNIYQYWKIWEAAVGEVLRCEQVQCNARDIRTVGIQQLWKKTKLLSTTSRGKLYRFVFLAFREEDTTAAQQLVEDSPQIYPREVLRFISSCIFWYRWWRIG